ncbi:prolipoprotein diacylglyceryl transferase family protein [Ciceribacter selenitireducens]
MNAISIGPLVFDVERLAAILGIGVFVTLASLLSSRADSRLGPWSTMTLVLGLIGARAGHVLPHLESFSVEPWHILAFWQGGFSAVGASAGVLLSGVLLLRRSPRLLPRAAASLTAGALVWFSTLAVLGANTAIAAPHARLATLDGRSIVLSERAGRPLVVNLWASWCPPCRREMPMMADMARSHPQIDFVFANQGEAADRVAVYLAKAGITIETVIADQLSLLSRHYGAPGLPATLFILPDGALYASHLGEISREGLSEQINKIAAPLAEKDM